MKEVAKEVKLRPKQKRFCEQYVTNGGNGAAAARIAGYSEKSTDSLNHQAAENLTKPHIVAFIAELRKAIGEDFAVTAEEVVRLLRKAVERGFADIPVLDREGSETGEYRNDLPSAIRATELLGKTIGVFVERRELSGANGAPLSVMIELPDGR